MKKLLLVFLAWVALGTGVYFGLGPIALVVYGVGTIGGALVWAVTQKPNLPPGAGSAPTASTPAA